MIAGDEPIFTQQLRLEMFWSNRNLFAATLLAASAIFGLSCSALVDLEECADASACATKYGRGWTCSSENLCERQALLDPQGPCSMSEGPINDPETFNIGVILPLSGEEGGDGQALLTAIKLAQNDFNQRSGVNNHEIGLIICDSQGKDEIALQAGDHLVNVSGVEAIIGPNSSSQTVDVATTHAIPNDVLLVSPSATASSISSLDDKNLVWRTTASDALQAYAMGLLVSDLIEEKKAEQVGDDPVKLVVLTRQDDLYAQGLRDSLLQYLPDETVNGGEDFFFAQDYQNISAGQGSDYTGLVAKLDDQRTEPDIVVILGFAEAWTIARQLDPLLEGDDTLYVLADAGRIADEAALVESDPLEGRVLGTAPRTPSSDYQPWKAFRIKFNAATESNAENIQYVANAYDALYAIALAAAGSGFTGPELAVGMSKLSDQGAEEIFANQDGAQDGMLARSQGKTINLQGASGELDFNASGDPTVGAISLWCLRDRRVPEEKTPLLNQSGEFQAVDCSPDVCTADTDCPTDHMCSTGGTCEPNSSL
jgi:branched-chain amino acid transport system substrate-binding protein